MAPTAIKSFLQKYLDGNYSEEEHQQFIDWLKTAPTEEVEAIAEEYKNAFALKDSRIANAELTKQIEAALDQYDLGSTSSEVRLLPLRPALGRNDRWKRLGIVAGVALLLGMGGYWIFAPRQARGDKQELAHDVKAPERNRATITTSDGKTIYLDSVSNGQLAVQGNIQLLKTGEGQIEYSQESGSGSQEAEIPSTSSGLSMTYHTLNNPKGSKVVDITLADGTHVWLNAGSSITYPMAFIGNERKVSMTGEAYFEVAKKESGVGSQESGKRIPFFVEANGTTTQVLGTHFNVNAYDDEEAVRVTLLEGSIRLTQNAQSKMLEPGEQGIADPSPSSGSGLRVTKDVNVDEVMAWKNGIFKFDEMTIEPLMRQIEKWYDVDVEYHGKVNSHFIATIPRTVSAMDAFKILEQTGGVHFTIEGRKVIVEE